MIPLAHSQRSGKPPQSYYAHVAGVVSTACKNVSEIINFADAGRAIHYLNIIEGAATCHDLGKLSSQNQDVLSGKNKAVHLPIEHRDAGVKHLIGSNLEQPSATLVYAHHRPGLPNMIEQKTQANPFRFLSALTDSDNHLDEYLALHIQETQTVAGTEPAGSTPRLDAMEYRMLLSCLVDADYSDTTGEQPLYIEPRWKERLEMLDRYVQSLQKGPGLLHPERNQLRSQFFAACRAAATQEPLEYCDSPVGTGKTTAVMAHMLKSAAENGLRHIFVILPYTNIISQTVEVLRKALVLDGEKPAQVIAEHHHQADFDSIELRHLATTWTAPIIVTTAVQFFETIASNIPSRLRKLHQLPGSGIMIDESHAALPLQLMPPAWKWITDLTNKWGCRFCLCSGTSFKFWENPIFTKLTDSKVHPLLTGELSDNMETFEGGRIILSAWTGDVPHFDGTSSLLSFLEQSHGSRLVVFNTVRSAAFFANLLRKSGHDVLHLSTALTPNDREKVIKEVKRRLDPNIHYDNEWTLVATSCVECGMDFSFHFGFCELRSLPSYLQLGGRISRNGEYSNGSLICFTITDDEFGNNPSFDISRSIFMKLIKSQRLTTVTITTAVSEGFDMECKELGGLPEVICKYERVCAFVDVADSFRIIPSDTITVVADQDLAGKVRSGEIVSARELQRGSLNIRKYLVNKLGIDGGELPILTDDQYDDFLGYMAGIFKLEQFQRGVLIVDQKTHF